MPVVQIDELKKRIGAQKYLVAVLVLVVLLYAPILGEVIPRWLGDPATAHGIFVPFMAALLLWWRRNELKNMAAHPSWWGIVPLAFGLLLEEVSWYARIQFFAVLSLVPVLIGVALLMSGWERTRHMFFPILFLVFMAPLPTWMILPVSFPIQQVSALSANWSAQQIGIVTVQEGFRISLANGTTVEVAEACSGFKKTLTVVVVASFYVSLFAISLWRQCLLVLVAIPLAVAANITRVTGMIAVGAWWGEAGVHRLHDIADPFVIVLCFVLLFYVGKAFGCKNLRYTLA